MNDSQPRVTVSMPFFERPARTIRAMESVLTQSIQDFEFIAMADYDPIKYSVEHDNKLSYLWFLDTLRYRLKQLALMKSIKFKIFQSFDYKSRYGSEHKSHYGGFGYHQINEIIQLASGKYFVFMSNDDVILPNHLENYLSHIENTHYDFVYFDSFVEPTNSIRSADIRHGCIGHSELIIRTDFLKKMPPHTPNYGHDWELIQNMVNAGAKYKKAITDQRTYIIKSIPDKREDGID